VVAPDVMVVAREIRQGVFVSSPGLGLDPYGSLYRQDPSYGFLAGVQGHGYNGLVSGPGLGATVVQIAPVPNRFGYATGAGSGYGLSGPVGNVGFGPYSIYGGYYNGYVPNAQPAPQFPGPATSGMFAQHPAYAPQYGHAPFNYYHFDEQTQQYVGAYVTEVNVGKG
jgi:hypothetical protein